MNNDYLIEFLTFHLNSSLVFLANSRTFLMCPVISSSDTGYFTSPVFKMLFP